MQYTISKVKKGLVHLAHLKRERALIGMPAEFKKVFLLLPALIHYHNSFLPGYFDDDVPHGIFKYQIGDDVAVLLKEMFGVKLWSSTANRSDISAIYTMGSTGTIGQSNQSDLDVWICIENNLSNTKKLLLQKKCGLIEDWAQELGVKLTLFVVDVGRFVEKHHECLMGENCGSAQHMLLLEEFYRSASLLAGKLLLWFAVPSTMTVDGVNYNRYNDCVNILVEQKLIDRSEWVDFGPLAGLSAEEYFGASLWQLYKSIDSPFKAVLKTLLLEAYSSIYPKNQPIAYQMKKSLHNGETTSEHLDSYYMLLERITAYLLEINDVQRLKLVRLCFYLKVNEKLSIPTALPTWRRKTLSKLVKEWGWDNALIKKLDSSHQWKIEEVRQVHEVLLETMMAGYRTLLNFGRRNNLNARVSPQDLAILTRKLYAEYEVLPGKITVLKLNKSSSLSEDALTFINVQENRINRAGWYVYNQKPDLHSIVSHQYLEYSKYLLKLVGWSYFNGLISDDTTFYCFNGSNHDNSRIKQLIADLQGYFPIDVPAVSESDLYGPCEIRHLAIMFNLESDPTAQDTFEYDVSNNVLNYGAKELSLVGSVDLLYRNSWNEIRVLHFSGSQCVLEAIQILLNRMHKDADLPNSIAFFCYSKYLQLDIKNQLKELIDNCIELRLSTTQDNSTQVKPLRINGASWYLFFERLGVSFHQFDNTIDFYGAVSNHKVQGRALNILDETDQLPKEIDSVACEGIIQFFFEDTNTGFDLYILNEHNQIEIYRNCNGNKDNMVKDINNYYALSNDRFSFASSSSINFNLPQFYQITENQNGQKKISPLN